MGTDIPACRYSICSPAPVVRDESRLITESVSAVRGDDSGAYYTAARAASRSSAYAPAPRGSSSCMRRSKRGPIHPSAVNAAARCLA